VSERQPAPVDTRFGNVDRFNGGVVSDQKGSDSMPMIDVYAPAGMFRDKHAVAQRVAAAVMAIEEVPNIAMFRENTAAFIHELPADAISDVDGRSDHVRVQVLTNLGALNRDKQKAVVAGLTEAITGSAGNPPAPERIWVLLTEAADGGWGLWGRAFTNVDLVAEVRSQLARIANVETFTASKE
jgi:phenylpyruvate tautomerase PptA (4-oxalocrotonate tautomerase family)